MYTHTHTHIYIYIYIYIVQWKRQLNFFLPVKCQEFHRLFNLSKKNEKKKRNEKNKKQGQQISQCFCLLLFYLCKLEVT